MNKEFFSKLLILGYGEVGKSEIFRCLIGDAKINRLGQYGRISNFNLVDNESIKYRFVVLESMLRPDLRKQQNNFDYVHSTFYRGTSIVLLVFDITTYESFRNLNGWYLNVLSASEIDKVKTHFIIVGNKKDLESSREVSQDKIKGYSKEIKSKYVEISAKEGLGIENLKKIIVETAKEFGKELKRAD